LLVDGVFNITKRTGDQLLMDFVEFHVVIGCVRFPESITLPRNFMLPIV